MKITKSIVLFGIKHSGKSTQAKSLANFFNAEFFDTDNIIEEITQKTPRALYNELGKEAFLQAEKNSCKILNEKMKNAPLIIATGGGICENPDAVNLLRENSIFVYLEIPEKIAVERIIREIEFEISTEKILNSKSLPSYISKENPTTIQDVKNIFHNFYENRTKKYLSFADITIEQENLQIQEISNLIIKKIKNF